MTWRVQIIGPERELRFIELYLKSLHLSTTREGDDLYMVCEAFQRLGSAADVLQHARRELAAINRAGNLQFDPFESFTLGRIQELHDDGSIGTHVVAEPGRLTLRAQTATIHAEGEVRAPDGTVKRTPPPEPIFARAIRHAEDDDLAYVLDLIQDPTWHNLYKIHERMRFMLGEKYLATIQRSKQELDRFTQTANHHARHDAKAKKIKPHKNPMTHDEAFKFVRRNVVQWLETLDS